MRLAKVVVLDCCYIILLLPLLLLLHWSEIKHLVIESDRDFIKSANIASNFEIRTPIRVCFLQLFYHTEIADRVQISVDSSPPATESAVHAPLVGPELGLCRDGVFCSSTRLCRTVSALRRYPVVRIRQFYDAKNNIMLLRRTKQDN